MPARGCIRHTSFTFGTQNLPTFIIIASTNLLQFGFLFLGVHQDQILSSYNIQTQLKLQRNRVTMLEGKALIADTDMPLKLQIQAMKAASEALDLYDVFDSKSIAAHIKKVIYIRFSMSILCEIVYF